MITAISLQRLFDLQKGSVKPQNENELPELKKEAAEYIAAVSDANIRCALYERYIACRSWDKIADSFSCGTADAVRKRVKRYLQSMAA